MLQRGCYEYLKAAISLGSWLLLEGENMGAGHRVVGSAERPGMEGGGREGCSGGGSGPS